MGNALHKEEKGDLYQHPVLVTGELFCAAVGRGREGGFISWMQQSFSPWRCGVALERPTAPSVPLYSFRDGEYPCFLPATLGCVWS